MTDEELLSAVTPEQKQRMEKYRSLYATLINIKENKLETDTTPLWKEIKELHKQMRDYHNNHVEEDIYEMVEYLFFDRIRSRSWCDYGVCAPGEDAIFKRQNGEIQNAINIVMRRPTQRSLEEMRALTGRI